MRYGGFTERSQPSRSAAGAIALFVVFLWATSWVLIKAGLVEIPALTFAGLAGIGDLIATCGSRLSRNHQLGEQLAAGRTWAEIEATLPGTAEGAFTVRSALALAGRLGVEMPIAREVERALFEGKSVRRCLVDLLSRESKDELADADAWLARLGVAGGTARPS